MGRFVDLHSHWLPGLDDGARTPELGLQMVSGLVALGFDQLHATPHQRPGLYFPSRQDIDTAFAGLRQIASEAFPKVEIGLAAENFWDDVLHQRLGAGDVPSYGAGASFLFELNPQMMPPRLEPILFQIRVSTRRLPVMAHPERYVAIQTDLARAEALGRTSALLVDLGALDGAHGHAEMKTARRLLQDGLAHAVASDIHSPEDVRSVSGGMGWIVKQLGKATLDRLLDENPRRILRGELP